MYYYLKMSKPNPYDEGDHTIFQHKYFRSLKSLLVWLQLKYGKCALSWSIDESNHHEEDARLLLNSLNNTIEEIDWQCCSMKLDTSCPDSLNCDFYFFSIKKCDGEPTSGFSFTEQDESSFIQLIVVFKPDVAQSIVIA